MLCMIFVIASISGSLQLGPAPSRTPRSHNLFVSSTPPISPARSMRWEEGGDFPVSDSIPLEGSEDDDDDDRPDEKDFGGDSLGHVLVEHEGLGSRLNSSRSQSTDSLRARTISLRC
jgi:hypothetical protein